MIEKAKDIEVYVSEVAEEVIRGLSLIMTTPSQSTIAQLTAKLRRTKVVVIKVLQAVCAEDNFVSLSKQTKLVQHHSLLLLLGLLVLSLLFMPSRAQRTNLAIGLIHAYVHQVAYGG